VKTVFAVLSPQLTVTVQELAPGVESLKDPSRNEVFVPVVAVWLPGEVTTTPPPVGDTVIVKLVEPDEFRLSVTVTVAVKVQLEV